MYQSATSRHASRATRAGASLLFAGLMCCCSSSPTWLEQRVVPHHRLPPHFAVHPTLGVPDDPVPAAQLHAVQGGAAGGARQAAAQRLLLLLGKQRKAHAAGRQAKGRGRWWYLASTWVGSRDLPPDAGCTLACRRHKKMHAGGMRGTLRCHGMHAVHAVHAVLPHHSARCPCCPHLYVKKY